MKYQPAETALSWGSAVALTGGMLIRFLLLLCALHSLSWAASPPNVVYLISDDHAWTDYGFMGHPLIETPHLDKLAARSAVFPRGYVPTALCRPALATFVTGQYAHQHQITGNDPARPAGSAAKGKGKGKAKADGPEYAALREQLIAKTDALPTLPRLLAARGYLSHQSGKWWEGSYQRGGFSHGMTRGFPQPGGRHGDAGLSIGREGMQPIFDFLQLAQTQQKPFFLWYAPMLPHSPHTPPERLFQKYKAKGISSDHVARYYAMVEWFDESCGLLMDRIQQMGQLENTLFVYVADNGWIQDPDSPKYAPRSKQTSYEGGIRQPIMFSWPSVIQPGMRGQQLCSSIDMLPTVLAATGCELPEKLPGLNLLPVLKTGQPIGRTECLGETFSHDIAELSNPQATLLNRWVIQGQWKLLLTYDGKLRSSPIEEARPQLFDLIADPHEKHNLAAQQPEQVSRLAQRLQDWWPVNERKVLTAW